MSLVIGARRHLEWGLEKFILETINSHPALVSILFTRILNNYFQMFGHGRQDTLLNCSYYVTPCSNDNDLGGYLTLLL
jgi:hypothetical protein